MAGNTLAYLTLILPGALVLSHCLYQIRRGRASKHWPLTPGVVGPRPRARFLAFPVPWIFGRFSYTYSVAGQHYVGRRIWFGSDLAFRTPNPAYTWLGDSYPPGAAVTVRYDPLNPGESTLKPGVSPGTYVLAAVSTVLMLGGVAMAGFG
jgi:hypothetical protein